MKEYLDGRLVVTTGDITAFAGDAIVNAANSSLLGGGGVDGAIHRTGGPRILAECKRIRSEHYPDGLPTGEAVRTTAGKLPAKAVIHTVGPVWYGGNQGEDGLLESAYMNSLRIAEEARFHSLAFPAISTGVYHFPKERAAAIAFRAIAAHLNRADYPTEVYLYFFSPQDMEIFVESV